MIYAIAALAIIGVFSGANASSAPPVERARRPLTAAAASLWQLPHRVTFDFGRAFWSALGDASRRETAAASNAAQRFVVQPTRHVLSALRSPGVRWRVVQRLVVSIAILVVCGLP